jgi:hypothetical protein
MDTKINLCNSCLNSFPECSPDRVEYINDEVIKCSSYDERKLVNLKEVKV